MSSTMRPTTHGAMLVVTGAAEELALLLEARSLPTGHAWLVAAGHCLTPLENVPSSMAESLAATARSFERSVGHGALPSSDFIELWQTALGRSALSMEVLHVWPAGFAAQEPWRFADPTLPPVLPTFAVTGLDVELLGLEHQMRRLIKREGLDEASIALITRLWRDRGLLTASLAGDRSTLFASDDSAVLERALVAERALRAGGAGRCEAVRELGLLLGYPKCCAEAFSRLEQGHDFLATARRVPAVPSSQPPSSPLALWIDPSLRLVSHLGCGLSCDATEALSRALLAEIARIEPELPDRWEQLARRVHVVTDGGRHLALEVRGDLAAGACVLGALGVVGDSGAARCEPVEEWVGLTLEPFFGGLRSTEGSHWAVLAADHRGDIR